MPQPKLYKQLETLLNKERQTVIDRIFEREHHEIRKNTLCSIRRALAKLELIEKSYKITTLQQGDQITAIQVIEKRAKSPP